jgi:hypothetical protein
MCALLPTTLSLYPRNFLSDFAVRLLNFPLSGNVRVNRQLGRKSETPPDYWHWPHEISKARGAKVQEWIPDWHTQGREGTGNYAGEVVGYDWFVGEVIG